MQWVNQAKWYIESDTGYRISKSKLPKGYVYQAWTPKRHKIGLFSDSEAAMKACEAYEEVERIRR